MVIYHLWEINPLAGNLLILSIQASQMYLLPLYYELLEGLNEFLQLMYCKKKTAVTWLQLFSHVPSAAVKEGFQHKHAYIL